uniref:Cadherin domain-containing protein n=1 Tax=Ciona savignyi TaxID=51511 RepID=H2YCE6_CIOSA
NDNAPLFTKSIYYVTLKENARLRHFRVEATDADNGDAGIVTYQISGGNDKGVFSINNVTGDVTNVKILDYEKLGGHVTLDVTAQDGGTDVRHSTTAQVVIRIDDVNDNPPKFPRSTQTSFQVQENIFGPKIAKFTAYDVDSGDNGRVTYSIVSGNDDSIFTISPLDGELRIAHGVELDREQRSDYNVTILAMDGGENPLNDTIVTQIHVVDTNDNSPQLTKFPNRINLSEDTVIGYPVYRVVALDPDSGNFGQMEFSIDDVDKTFSINKKSGQIYLVKSLDRESVSEYNLHVIVRDNPSDLSNSRTSRRTLQVDCIIVDDVNDETPQFVGIPYIGEITENSPPGTQVQFLTSPILAVDADDGANSYVTYSIVTSSYFVIDHQTGTLRTIVNIGSFVTSHRILYFHYPFISDREEMLDDVIEVTVRASDGTMTSETVARVTVKDLNDNPPRFASRRVRTRVPEDMTCCRVIARMSASDPDKDDNGRLFYTIVSGAHDRFVVDRETGIISVAPGQSLDREMTSQYKLVVRATDHAANPLSSTAVVMVTVDDVNDSRPRFLSTFQQISIHENSPVGSKVTTLVATDDDLDPDLLKVSNYFQIDVIDQNDNSPTIRNDNGDVISGDVIMDVEEEIAVGSVLGRFIVDDVDQGLNCDVTYEIGGPGRRLVGIVLRMRVNDVNDNRPVFTQSNYDMEIPEDAEPGSFVTSVTASDRDDAAYGDVTYTLHGDLGFFTIHPNLGDVRVAKPLDREIIPEHQLTIVASDNARGTKNNRRTTTKKVVMTLSDVNDNVPIFTGPLVTSFEVFENSTPGSLLSMVTAADRDHGRFGHVTYSLRAFADFFSIDPISGDVTISRQIVASQRHPLVGDVVIFATDGGGRESNMTLTVEIIDVNDHVPKFEAPTFNVIRIPEEEPGGLFVTQARAIDDDIGLNAVVRYRLHDPDMTNQNAFFIDDVSGRLLTSRKLDRELRHTYSVVIQAHDLGRPQLQSSRILTVILDDVNDNRPAFVSSGAQATQAISIPEDAAIGSIVGHVTRATDRDESARIFYHILTQDVTGEQIFKLEGEKIILAGNLDREHVDSYQLIVGATNNANFTPADVRVNDVVRPIDLMWDPSRDDSLLRLYVTVDDVIDEPPRFSRNVYVTAVEGNTQPRTKLIKVNVTDDDVGDHVTYSIVHTTFHRPDNTTWKRRNAFVIDPTTTRCRTMSPSNGGSTGNSRDDYALLSNISTSYHSLYFTLTVQARDSANQSASCKVIVHILRRSKKIQFVLDSPPDVVRAQQEKFSELLRSMTGSIVSVDYVNPHVTSDEEIEDNRSDVIIRIFDPKDDIENILQNLKGASPELRRMFRGYSFV